MFKLYGFEAPNTYKVIYTLEYLNLGKKYEVRCLNLFEEENRTSEILKLNPFGKVPILEEDGQGIFESATICRYLANKYDKSIYPDEPYLKSQIDQWIDFYNCHLGRWLTNLFFEIKIKDRTGKPRNLETINESLKWATVQLEVINKILEKNKYLAGEDFSLADIYSYSYFWKVEEFGIDIDHFTNVERWMSGIKFMESTLRAEKIIEKIEENI